jgi:hypothetical protein
MNVHHVARALSRITNVLEISLAGIRGMVKNIAEVLCG